MNRRQRWVLVWVTAVLAVIALNCGCGAVILWAMLGAPWPIEPSAFVG